jgi:hypothetical protein
MKIRFNVIKPILPYMLGKITGQFEHDIVVNTTYHLIIVIIWCHWEWEGEVIM